MISHKFIKEEVIAAFGGANQLAIFLGVHRQAIYQWPNGKPIPALRRYEIKERRPDLVEAA